MDRRDFIKTILATLTIRAVGRITWPLVSGHPVLWGDGLHDDTDALQALLDGEEVYLPNGDVFSGDILSRGTYLLSDRLTVTENSNMLRVEENTLIWVPHAKDTGIFRQGSGPLFASNHLYWSKSL